MRAFAAACAMLLCFAFSGVSSASADDKDDARSFANDLGNQALSVIVDKGLNKQAKRARLEGLFEQNVNIEWIAKFVLGRYWRSASEQQKHDYLANYKTFLIKHYTSNLTEFTDANFEVTKVVPEDGGGNIVTMHLKRPGAEDTIVNYTIRKNNGGKLNVYDMTVEGVSMITTQRSEFNSVASQKGLDYLISQLATRSQQDETN